jgi:hypothetical protein
MKTQAEKWLEKRQKKAQYWQVKVFLDGLRLKYKEMNKDVAGGNKVNTLYYIEVPLFGIKFRFSNWVDYTDSGWKIFYLDIPHLDKDPYYFRDEVMWYLVGKGYMAYIREHEAGVNGNIFKSILIDAGWAAKIINKRLELCGNIPENNFMKTRMEVFKTVPLPKLISYYPDFFDYLF